MLGCTENFEKRDVMVGVLRNRKQLDYNIKYKFYHIPEEWVLEKRLPIKYAALYQAPRLFEADNSGVYLYGEVIGAELLPRSQITRIPTNQNPNKLYYKFSVDKWIPLDNPISAGNIVPDVNVFTSLYQLLNAEDISELFLERKEHWDFYRACRKSFPKAILAGKGDRICGVSFDEYYAEWKAERVNILKANRRILKKADIRKGDWEEIFKSISEKFEKN